MGTYVYGVVGPSHPQDVEGPTGVGADETSVRTLHCGGLVAVVSHAPEDLRARRRDLLAHERVVEQLCAQGPTLPMRFGIVADDDAAVIAQVSQRTERYRVLLDEVSGCVEENVKAVHDEEELLREILQDTPDLRALNQQLRSQGGGRYEDQLHFGELVAHAVEQRKESDAIRIAEQLAPYGLRTNTGPATGQDFMNLSLLVRNESVAEFRAAVRDLGAALIPTVQLRLRSGLPPYSFAALDSEQSTPPPQTS